MDKIIQHWYKVAVALKKWIEYYSKIPGYTLLAKDGPQVWVGSCGVEIPEGALEITNYDELIQIQQHRELSHTYPQPIEKINEN